jgi:hypothetical protein
MPIKFIIVVCLLIMLPGCVLTKVVTVPMRVGGAVISVLPGAGNPTQEAIDTAADAVDEIPL